MGQAGNVSYTYWSLHLNICPWKFSAACLTSIVRLWLTVTTTTSSKSKQGFSKVVAGCKGIVTSELPAISLFKVPESNLSWEADTTLNGFSLQGYYQFLFIVKLAYRYSFGTRFKWNGCQDSLGKTRRFFLKLTLSISHHGKCIVLLNRLHVDTQCYTLLLFHRVKHWALSCDSVDTE